MWYSGSLSRRQHSGTVLVYAADGTAAVYTLCSTADSAAALVVVLVVVMREKIISLFCDITSSFVSAV